MINSGQYSAVHCHQFDTHLLEQIIEFGVDAAVRQLCHEKSVPYESINQSEWIRIIMHHVTAEMVRMANNHRLLPTEIDAEIKAEIAELVDREMHKCTVSECASFVRPVHGLLRVPHHANILWRKLFEK